MCAAHATGRGRDDDDDDDNYSFLRLKNWGAFRILCVLGAAELSKLKPDTIFERAGPGRCTLNRLTGPQTSAGVLRVTILLLLCYNTIFSSYKYNVIISVSARGSPLVYVSRAS